MSETTFKVLITLWAAAFTLGFAVIVIPGLVDNPDVIGAFAAGFVNPFASGYSMDTIACWGILTTWVAYERKTKGIKHGWVAVLLGIAPGVAVGFAFYLFQRLKQEHSI